MFYYLFLAITDTIPPKWDAFKNGLVAGTLTFLVNLLIGAIILSITYSPPNMNLFLLIISVIIGFSSLLIINLIIKKLKTISLREVEYVTKLKMALKINQIYPNNEVGGKLFYQNHLLPQFKDCLHISIFLILLPLGEKKFVKSLKK